MSRHAADSSYGERALLSTTAITTAVTGVTSTAVDYPGVTSATFEAVFVGGADGTSATAVVETQLPSGGWVPIVSFDFANTAGTKIATLSARTPVTTIYTVAALSANTVKDGILGDSFRTKLTTVGTYTGTTTIAVYIQPKGH